MNDDQTLPMGANRTIKVAEKELNWYEKVFSVLMHVLRFFQLAIIFLPPIVLSPLLLFRRTTPYWMDCFVKAIERAGVVWIKAFQYLSHRRDIIGEEMAGKFIHLRENAPTHSWEETRKNFRQAYGKNIEDIF